MAYTGTTAQPTNPPDASTTHPSTPGRGHSRVKGSASAADIALLASPITFPFSGRVAPNRFLKAPMTERLCRWSNEDIVPLPPFTSPFRSPSPFNFPTLILSNTQTQRGMPTPEFQHLYERWGEGGIGVIVQGNTMVAYDAVEALGNPILVDDHDGRVDKYRDVARVAKQHGSLFIAQLSHPGRQGGKALNPNPVSASEVQLMKKWAGNEFAKPR